MKIVVFGNSGSGKSTYAKKLAKKNLLSHLDLDTVAWKDSEPMVRRPIEDSKSEISNFIDTNKSWVIEGCYSGLLLFVLSYCNEVYFLNPGVDTCVHQCKTRPFEPHKYKSIEEQNKNLEMLVEWVSQYPNRGDEFSLKAHRKLFDSFLGKKREFTDPTDYR